MSCCQYRFPWPSLATCLYRPSLSAGPPGYILYRHRATVNRFELVVQPSSSMGGGHWITSLTSSSLLLQQCPAHLVPLIWMVFVMGGKLPYRCCFVECCLYDSYSNHISCRILYRWQTTKNSWICKNIIYIFILRRRCLCEVGIQ